MFNISNKYMKVRQYSYRETPIILPSSLSGLDHLRETHMNKGQAFSMHERQTLRIQGLLAPGFRSLRTQLILTKTNFSGFKTNLEKYLYLIGVADRNERLFYNFVAENIEDCLPIVYTPTVGLACLRYGFLAARPRGLFITIYDKGHIIQILENWPDENVRVIVVTDGERILGLGDLGSHGMGIPVGKLSLYTALAGVCPHLCLPITLDVGTNNQELLNSPFYIGLRQKRVVGQAYDDFLDEFMAAVVQRFGRECLIQFEDFAQNNALRLLLKYRDNYCMFNDDIQGTAAVVASGLYSAMRVLRKPLKDQVILFHGAGSAALGIAHLLVQAMQSEGLSQSEAEKRIWMDDLYGLLVKSRTPKPNPSQEPYVKNVPPTKSFLEAVKIIKPSIIIGVSAHKGGFTKEVLEEMARINDRPVIFALSNPTDKAECTSEEAIKATKGKCIFSSGSPFPPVKYNGKTYHTSQVNNSYIFPGIGLGILCTGMLNVPDRIFLIASKTVASLVTEQMLEQGTILPPISEIRDCSVKIAECIMEFAYKNGLATSLPEPKDYAAAIVKEQYNLKYPYYGAAIYDIPYKVVSSDVSDEEKELYTKKPKPKEVLMEEDKDLKQSQSILERKPVVSKGSTKK
ncbi:NADP-dependent malic enzyme-like [Chrysoperla carnea]|uniref:NADP-dependent malic enzyme-like n=1 Tax=Chrysoperla carnea TaxID=189513 RepID=UPI001D085419|nr:NADP-dependent malic enzyme-like [Chrysoperla carnea]